MDQTTRAAVLREFLIGTLSEPDTERVERDLLSDDELYELLLATEEELIDECVDGTLPDVQARRFLLYLSTIPGGGERIELAKALRATLSSRPSAPITPITDEIGTRARPLLERRDSPVATWRRWIWPAAALVAPAVVAIAFLTLLSGREAALDQLRADLARSRAESDELRSRIAEREEAPEPVSPSISSSPAVPSVVLTAGLRRGKGSLQTVSVSRSEPVLEWKLDLGADDYRTYRAVLHDAESTELFAVSGLEASVAEDRIWVSFTLPLDRLATGDYYVFLEGLDGAGDPEPVGRYDFRLLVD